MHYWITSSHEISYFKIDSPRKGFSCVRAGEGLQHDTFYPCLGQTWITSPTCSNNHLTPSPHTLAPNNKIQPNRLRLHLATLCGMRTLVYVGWPTQPRQVLKNWRSQLLQLSFRGKRKLNYIARANNCTRDWKLKHYTRSTTAHLTKPTKDASVQRRRQIVTFANKSATTTVHKSWATTRCLAGTNLDSCSG